MRRSISTKGRNPRIDGKYQFTPAFFVGAQYVYTMENYDASSGGVKPKIHSAGLMADYNLSKRTDVYISGDYLRASDGVNAVIGYSFTPSSTSTQADVRIGMRHSF